MKIINIDECKSKRKKNTAFIKKKIKKANEIISSKNIGYIKLIYLNLMKKLKKILIKYAI